MGEGATKTIKKQKKVKLLVESFHAKKLEKITAVYNRQVRKVKDLGKLKNNLQRAMDIPIMSICLPLERWDCFMHRQKKIYGPLCGGKMCFYCTCTYPNPYYIEQFAFQLTSMVNLGLYPNKHYRHYLNYILDQDIRALYSREFLKKIKHLAAYLNVLSGWLLFLPVLSKRICNKEIRRIIKSYLLL